MNIAEKTRLLKTDVMPSCLRLSLKTKWFEMSKAGIKTEDYRDINHYWIKRLMLKKYNTIFDVEVMKILRSTENIKLEEVEQVYQKTNGI